MRDVARVAGVSITTVSRVLNGSELVAPGRRSAVEEALQSLDFVPNHFARSLISRRSRAIGLIVPTLANPVFAPSIAAIEAALGAEDYALLIHCCERDPEREYRQARSLIDRGVDGLILTGSLHAPGIEDMLERRGVPFVSQDVASIHRRGPAIALPNAAAMKAAVDHLYGLGHREIAILSGPTHNTPPMRDRLSATIDRLAQLGCAPPPHWVVETSDYAGETLRRAGRRLVEGSRRPTSVVCTGDILALGLVAECRSHGLRVPNDLSIVGCGDTDLGHLVDPPLTTVRMPFCELGTRAASMLLAMLAGRTPDQAVTTLGHELVTRGSAVSRRTAEHTIADGRSTPSG